MALKGESMLSPNEVNYLNSFKREWLEFDQLGLILKYKGRLKEFIESFSINSEFEFEKEVRDGLFIPSSLDIVSYCCDNNSLYPYHYGLTSSPIIGVDGILGIPDMLPKFVFWYSDYALRDSIKFLRENGSVRYDYVD